MRESVARSRCRIVDMAVGFWSTKRILRDRGIEVHMYYPYFFLNGICKGGGRYARLTYGQGGDSVSFRIRQKLSFLLCFSGYTTPQCLSTLVP